MEEHVAQAAAGGFHIIPLIHYSFKVTVIYLYFYFNLALFVFFPLFNVLKPGKQAQGLGLACKFATALFLLVAAYSAFLLLDKQTPPPNAPEWWQEFNKDCLAQMFYEVILPCLLSGVAGLALLFWLRRRAERKT